MNVYIYLFSPWLITVPRLYNPVFPTILPIYVLYICIYIYIYVCVYIYINMYIYIYIYIHKYVYIYICMYIYLFIYLSLYLSLSLSIYIFFFLIGYCTKAIQPSVSNYFTHICVVYMYIYIYIYMCVYIYINMYIYIYIYINMYIYIYMYEYLSIHLSIYLSLSLSLYIYIYILHLDWLLYQGYTTQSSQLFTHIHGNKRVKSISQGISMKWDSNILVQHLNPAYQVHYIIQTWKGAVPRTYATPLHPSSALSSWQKFDWLYTSLRPKFGFVKRGLHQHTHTHTHIHMHVTHVTHT